MLFAKTNRKAFAMMSLDITKCFDTMKHRILQKKIVNAGLTEGGFYEQWIMGQMASRKFFTEINNTASSTRLHTWGIPQGSVLSPVLCAIYLSDLDLTKSTNDPSCMHPYANHGINQGNFADDTMVGAIDNGSGNVATHLCRAIKLAHAWGAKNGMQFSLLKGNVLFKANNRSSQPIIHFQRPNELTLLTLPSNNHDPSSEPERSTRYLGQHFTQKFDSQLQLKKTTRKAQSDLRHIRILEHPDNMTHEITDPNTRLTIYKTISRPRMIQFLKLNFACVHETPKEFKTIENTALRIVTGAKKPIRNNLLRKLTNLAPMTEEAGRILTKLLIKYAALNITCAFSDIFAIKSQVSNDPLCLRLQTLWENLNLMHLTIKKCSQHDDVPLRSRCAHVENKWPQLKPYKGTQATVDSIKAAKLYATKKISHMKKWANILIYTDGAACPDTMAYGTGYYMTDRDDHFLAENGKPGESLGSSFEAEVEAIHVALDRLMEEKLKKKIK